MAKRMKSVNCSGQKQHDQLGHANPPKRGLTFRVRGVPIDWDIDRLKSFLADQDDSAGPIVPSLALEIHGRSRTATVAFQNVPRPLQTSPIGRSWQIPHPEAPGLSLDDDFFGITTLFAPPPQDHKVEYVGQSPSQQRANQSRIVAISGLGGHAFGSFKERGGEHMWLRDALPHNITQEGDQKPCARVMIYGYESSLPQSQSIQNIEDLATSFHNSLLALISAANPRPIIFIAHSLGGLIVKQASPPDILSVGQYSHET